MRDIAPRRQPDRCCPSLNRSQSLWIHSQEASRQTIPPRSAPLSIYAFNYQLLAKNLPSQKRPSRVQAQERRYHEYCASNIRPLAERSLPLLKVGPILAGCQQPALTGNVRSGLMTKTGPISYLPYRLATSILANGQVNVNNFMSTSQLHEVWLPCSGPSANDLELPEPGKVREPCGQQHGYARGPPATASNSASRSIFIPSLNWMVHQLTRVRAKGATTSLGRTVRLGMPL